MHRLVTILAVLLCLIAPAVAADYRTEVAGGFSLTDSDAAQSYTLAFDLQAPIAGPLAIGPAVALSGVDPDGGESISIVQVGARATLGLTGAQGLYGALTALYLTGDADGILIVPELGVRWVKERGGVRVGASRPYSYSQDDGAVDLETTAVTAALLLRF